MARFNTNINASHNCLKCGLALQLFKSKRPGRNFDCIFVTVSKSVHFCLAKADLYPSVLMLHIIIPCSSPLGLVASNQPLARDSLRAPSPSANVFVPLVLSKPKTSKCSECGARTHRHCPNRRYRQHCLEDGKPCLVHTPDSPAPMPSTHTNIDDTLALLGHSYNSSLTTVLPRSPNASTASRDDPRRTMHLRLRYVRHCPRPQHHRRRRPIDC
ncbi:hypothetical protein K438DRAFT_144541 [Mycena galopus ATCC 62051]|nr:hypothetical protein K438DRAFT_144541 [Mycena galopus ATCC 62051]